MYMYAISKTLTDFFELPVVATLDFPFDWELIPKMSSGMRGNKTQDLQNKKKDLIYNKDRLLVYDQTSRFVTDIWNQLRRFFKTYNIITVLSGLLINAG